MKKAYLFKYGLLVLLIFCFLAGSGQKNAFSGKIVDEFNQPLSGATIHVKGSDQTAVTDKNGRFLFPIDNQSALAVTISFVGYDALERVIMPNEGATIQLVPNAKSLADVVVLGYGSVKKSDLTGSVTNLGAKDLNPGPIINPLQQLEGKAAGVNVTQIGNEPGVPPTVRIRGITSLVGGNDPLVVVDGIQGNIDLLNQVPPSEIASVNILKDASATAIYGSRGAPGVIIITTKKNGAGGFQIEYTENSSLDVIPKKLHELNAAEWTQEAIKLGVDPSANHGANTDWYDLLTQNGYTQNHTLAFGSGDRDFNYRASVSALSQTGVVLNSHYKNYIARLTATQKGLDDHLTLTMNLNSGITDGAYSPESVGRAAFTSNLISNAYISRPTDPVYNGDGTYYVDPNVFHYVNPYAVAKTVINSIGPSISPGSPITYPGNNNYLFGSLRADLDIYKGISAGWFGSWRKVSSDNGQYFPAASTLTLLSSTNLANISNNHVDEKLMDVNISYKHDFRKNHVDATAVYEWQAQTYNGDFVQARNFINDITTFNALQNGDLADVLPGDISSYKNDRRLVSFLGRVNYSFDGRYLLTASFRRDGSTVFGANHKWGNFPSAALAWNITHEDFMKDQTVFSSLKLRGGYGVTGNQQGIGPQNSIALVGAAGVVNFSGTNITNYNYTQNANPDLRWETKKQTDIGVDLVSYNSRFAATLDVYSARTENLLYNYTVPVPPFQFSNILANIGTLQNQGVELTLSYQVIKTPTTLLTLAGNATLLRNKVITLSGTLAGQTLSTDYVGYGNAYLVQGKPIGTFLVLKHLGIDSTGAETVVDVNKDGTIDDGAMSKDRVNEGQALPTYEYAFTPSFSYKRFDLSMVWRGAGGNKVYNTLRESLSLLQNLGKSNVLESAIPLGIVSAPHQSDLWLESGAFLRWQNLSIGYRFDVSSIKFISSLRVSANANNLALITKYKGLDPEVDVNGDNGSGGDNGIYPKTRTFSLGLNVSLK
jgi:TonB-linked SusC/RagA family outer membrane protein